LHRIFLPRKERRLSDLESDFHPDDSLAALLKSRAVEDEVPIRIAHLSDPHFSSVPRALSRLCGVCFGIYGHRQEAWEALPTLNSPGGGPDILVVSGDLTAFGTAASFRYAREAILTLAHQWQVEDRNIFVVPGNHDRFLGYLGSAFGSWLKRFEDFFGDLSGSRIIDAHGQRVLVYPFDSTEEGFRLWPFFANTGRVSRQQFNQFNRVASAAGADSVLAIVHHHPLPVPLVDQDGFTVMKNGGAFMAHMQSSKVQLVMHGHMHSGYSCRINYSEDTCDTVIVAAGTACQQGRQKNSVSLIDFSAGRRVAVRVYSYEETGFRPDPARGRTYRLLV
jgi:3',5'-cyclic AMP phosphodiesterase CpdA